MSIIDQIREIRRRKAAQLAAEQAAQAAASQPVLKTAPVVNGTTTTKGPTLAPDGNGGIAPAVPVPLATTLAIAPLPKWVVPAVIGGGVLLLGLSQK